jgi:hypothetical protein
MTHVGPILSDAMIPTIKKLIGECNPSQVGLKWQHDLYWANLEQRHDPRE